MIALIFFILVFFSSSAFHIGGINEQITSLGLGEQLDHCIYGRYQSPIHIEEHFVERSFLPALEFSGYHNYLTPPITLTNNGHTVVLKGGYASEDKRPHVTGSVLSSRYVFESLHFHWGTGNNNGSEHVLYSMRYPMEMHLVHRNVLYNSTQEAMQHKDGLVVLGFFFNVRMHRDNGRYRELLKHFRHISEPNLSYELRKTFPLSSLLPSDLDVYFVYEGSLTTPPCSEAVTWFVFQDPIPVSDKQMQYFRQLPIHENFRETQVIGQRRIMLRRYDRTILTPDLIEPSTYFQRSFWLH